MTGRAEESDYCDGNMADHHTLENSLQLSDERSDMNFRQIYFHFLEKTDLRNEELQIFNYRRDGNFKAFKNSHQIQVFKPWLMSHTKPTHCLV